MKKTLTLLLVALTSLSFAQVDWAINSVKSPTNINSTSSGTSFDIVLECENKGTDTIQPGDSIIFNMLLIDLETSNVWLQYPANAASGNYSIVIATEQILPGATYDITQTGLSTSLIVRDSRNMRMGINTYLFDRSNPIIDDDSTNNSTFRDLIWFNEYGNGVSVNEVKYNGDIAAYPNPANDILNVEITHTQISGVKLELVDLTGKTVVSHQVEDVFSTIAYQINVSAVENGIYILKVTNGDEILTTKVTVSH
ncbi:MAG: hypothetical protein COA58_12780 [Bacteroidetes bacterium]|nr:MAG: hypothetical protein COA58_12780 [Bacteroidota bacterium]